MIEPKIKKGSVIFWLMILSFMMSSWLLYKDAGNLFCWIQFIIVFLLLFCYRGANKVARLFHLLFEKKQDCPYYMKEDCPYGNISQCPYDTSNCYSFQPRKQIKWRTSGVFILLLLSIGISFLSVLLNEFPDDLVWVDKEFDWKIWVKILEPITGSIIAAILCAFIMDIPARMHEYQEYFINILSSSDYLKQLSEDDLMKLRKRITLQLHLKDVPNMPKGMIKMDERILEMLKQPYYKNYNQTVIVKEGEKNTFKKSVRIQYTAFNPYDETHPVTMDIGIANSLKFIKEITPENAKELLKITKYSITADDNTDEIDMTKVIKLVVLQQEEEGLLYNGKIITKIDGNNVNNPFVLNSQAGKSPKRTEMAYEMNDTESIGLFVKFKKKMSVTIHYEIVVPQDDLCYTKRLRHPVKYFHLDYKFDDNLKYKLVGQLLGTLIDQPDVTTEHATDKHICLRTRNWLLPKNGVIIVHCKE